jgi:hypothetical protein
VVDPGPVRWWDRPKRPHEGPMYTTGPGRMTGSIWHRRSRPRRAGRATASNLDTHLDRGFGRKVRMLLSFQRPSHLFGRGFLPGARPKPSPIPERTGEYSARIAGRCRAAEAMMPRPAARRGVPLGRRRALPLRGAWARVPRGARGGHPARQALGPGRR